MCQILAIMFYCLITKGLIRITTRKLRLYIHEIAILLSGPLEYDPESYAEMLAQGSNTLVDKNTATQLSRSYDVENIDELFANEINSLYYLSLVNENTFQVMDPMNYYAQVMSNAEEEFFASINKRHISVNGEDIDGESDQPQKQKQEDRYSIIPGSRQLPPKERLLSILKSDEDIREWFSKWLGDLLNYQHKTINKMNTIFDEIGALEGN
jgi:hypothetical protein